MVSLENGAVTVLAALPATPPQNNCFQASENRLSPAAPAAPAPAAVAAPLTSDAGEAEAADEDLE